MSKTIPQLNTVPGGVTAANLFLEVARQITAGNFNGESEKISADALFALLAGTSLTLNIIQRLNPTGVAYNPATTYTLYDYLDVAYQDGHYAYINPAPSAGHLPTDSAYWLLISSDGADGAAGASGLTQAQADARYPLKTDPDPYPTYLTQAEAAALFSPLGGDAQGGLRYALSLATTSPPSLGQVRFNNAAIASVTQIFIHESDRNSAAQSEILDAIALGTRLQVALESNEEIYAWFRVSGAVVDNGSDRAIPVAFISSAGVFAAEEVTLNFLQIQGAASSGGATGRITCTAPRTYYVRKTGTRTGALATETDATTNTDLDAFGTITNCLNALKKLDFNGFPPTIFAQLGTYVELINLPSLVGADFAFLKGDGLNTIFTFDDALTASFFHGVIQALSISTAWQIEDCTITTTTLSRGAILCRDSRVFFRNIRTDSHYYDFWVLDNAVIEATGNYSFSRNKVRHVYCEGSGIARIQLRVVSIVGNPAFSDAGIYCAYGSPFVAINGTTFLGNATGQKYFSAYGGRIVASAGIELPGSLSGVSTPEGFYNTI